MQRGSVDGSSPRLSQSLASTGPIAVRHGKTFPCSKPYIVSMILMKDADEVFLVDDEDV
jgi:hypothetical protein